MSSAGFRDELADEMINRAKAVVPLLRRNAAAHEQNGELTPEVVRALDDAEFWKMAVPRRWGGLCLSSNTMAQVGAELAKGCPSASWVVAVMNSGIWMLAVLGDAVQEAIFANGIPRCASVGAPPGAAKPVEGGYIVNGRWPYSSGSHHADVIFGPVMIEGREGPAAMAMAIVPKKDFTIDRTWLVAGMKGTGSDTTVVKDVFVPAAMVAGMDQMAPDAPGKTHTGEALDHWTALPLLRSKALGVLVGTAEGLLAQVIESSKNRPIVHTTYQRKMDSPVFQAAIGEAAAKIATARLLMDATTKATDAAAIARRKLTVTERAMQRGKTAMSISLMNEAVDQLMSHGGSSSFMESNDAQRYWRDYSTGSRHVTLLADVGYEVLGRDLLGVENITFPDFI